MATYYVAANGSNSNNGTSPLTPWARHPWDKNASGVSQATVLQPGDIVYMRRGDIWYDSFLTANDAGANNTPIHTTSADSFCAVAATDPLPILSGALLPSSLTWVNNSGTVYSAAVATDPKIVVYNNVMLVADTNNSPALGKFYWTAGTLYVNVGESPANGVVEAGSNNYVCLTSANYQKYSNLELRVAKTTVGGVFYANQNIGIVVDGCTIKYSALHCVYADVSTTANASFHISNSSISGSANNTNSSGIRIKGGAANSSITVEDNIIATGYPSGISTTTAGPTTGIITNNTIHGQKTNGTSSHGINIANGDGWTITNNRISDIGDINGSDVCGIKIETNSNTIHNNTIDNIRGVGIYTRLVSSSNNIKNNTITNCGYKNAPGDVFLFYGSGGGGGAIEIGGTAAANTVEKNIIASCYLGISINTTGGAGGNIIRYNQASNLVVNGIGVFQDGSPTSRNVIANNTVYHSPSGNNNPAYTGHAFHAQDVASGGVKAAFVNNTAYNAVADAASHSFFASKNAGSVSIYLQNNCWSGAPGAVLGYLLSSTPRATFADWVSDARASTIFGDMAGVQANAEAGSIGDNPLFLSANDYRLQPTSPCIGAGAIIAGIHDQATPATDADGKIVHFQPNIGAYDGRTSLTVTANYAPTGYTVRGTDTEPATIIAGADDITINLSGLTNDEAIVVNPRNKRLRGFTAKNTKQYVKGSSGGSRGGFGFN